jgi:hypothetical protein
MRAMSKNKGALSKEQKAKGKAEVFYLAYRLMGLGRSLVKLYEECAVDGPKIALNTLKEYSRKYKWQHRLLKDDIKHTAQIERVVQLQVEKMNQQHAEAAQGMMAMVLAALKDYQDTIKDKDGNLKLSPKEMAGLFRAAQHGERLARGQTTSRVQVWVDIAQTVVREFGLIFLSVNEIENKVQRKAEYIRLADDMVKRYYSEASKQAMQIER